MPPLPRGTAPDLTVRYGARDGSGPPDHPDYPACPGCGGPLPSSRARSCSAACKQRAHRLRQAAPALSDPSQVPARLKRRGLLTAQTIYECSLCETRYLGQRRCDECNRFCRGLGLGGLCPHCDEPLLITELLGEEVCR